MRFIYPVVAMIFVGGCSGEQIAHDINRVQIAMVGNKPPTSFKVANLQTMKDYVFNMDDYTIAMPGAKVTDFRGNSQYGGKKAWKGLTHYNKDITLYLEGYYHISVTASKVFEYGERERALENGTRNFPKQRTNPNVGIININVHREFKGKENYPCVVSSSISKSNKYRVGYRCYKFNKDRTKAKYVSIRLTYHKPTNPTLAKQYTFKDLKHRAKRMLDSLYIKDKW